MKNKREIRQRRARRTRMNIRENGAIRLCVHKTSQHVYAQITTSDGAKTLIQASTLDKDLQGLTSKGNKDAAKAVGKLIAERALKAGIDKVAFDRSGFLYHGRIKALADAAREAGLNF